ncbi:MAG: hypothetical protein J0M08_02215 [Bacteroidetes bacterium]|nr:hypothetical protein [Bacteroidota bacterium]
MLHYIKQNKLNFLITLCIVAILVFFGFNFFRSKKNKPSFVQWYEKHVSKKESFNNSQKYPLHTFEYVSPNLVIDSIYMSMKGPFNVNYINLSPKGNNRFLNYLKKTEIYWLVGYSVEILDSNNKPLPDIFLCHNNLDIYDKTTAPWQINTIGTFCRIFTLTGGQTEIKLPKGYGVPIASWQDLTVTSQALNHNYPNIHLATKQRVKVYYLKDSELDFSMQPVYQQAIFVTKQLSGPEGEFAKPPKQFSPTSPITIGDTSSTISYSACCTGRVFDENFNPYKDNYNRTYTGHWNIAPGYEKLTSNITLMLDLKYDTKIRFIGIHAHPYSESLELIDKTENKSLFKGKNKSFSDKIGLAYLDSYSDTTGIQLYKTHEYVLISEYNNPQQVTHTAMATMFVYLEEK